MPDDLSCWEIPQGVSGPWELCLVVERQQLQSRNLSLGQHGVSQNLPVMI